MASKRLTDKRTFEAVYELWLVDGYPPTTSDVAKSLVFFTDIHVQKALERSSLRGKVIAQGQRWMPPRYY